MSLNLPTLAQQIETRVHFPPPERRIETRVSISVTWTGKLRLISTFERRPGRLRHESRFLQLVQLKYECAHLQNLHRASDAQEWDRARSPSIVRWLFDYPSDWFP